MSSYSAEVNWTQIQNKILQLEQEGKVTPTFCRLNPDRQRAVIEAILDESSLKGPTALNIKEVARRAGVSVGSLYQYFGSRAQLLDFAVALSMRHTLDLFEQFSPMLAALPLRDGLRSYLLGGIEWGKMEVGLAQFIGRAAYQGDPALTGSVVEPVAEVMLGMVRSMLEAAMARGEIRPDIDLEAVTRALNALMIAAGDAQLLPYLNGYYRVSDETMPFDRVVTALIDAFLDGIAPPEKSTNTG